jgi:hypothetical protein
VQGPQAAADAEKQEEPEEREEREDDGAGVPGRIGKGAQRASRAAGCGRAEDPFACGQSATRGRGGKDPAAATTAATEQAFARAFVGDSSRASGSVAGLRSGGSVTRRAGPVATRAAAAATRRRGRACDRTRGGRRGVGNRRLDRFHIRKRRCRWKRRNLGNLGEWRNWWNRRNLNRWKLGEWRKLCRGSRAARRHDERENDQ